jgi:peptidoglycan/xylan/chitin deacetylase (PgdA/CDA1 family)
MKKPVDMWLILSVGLLLAACNSAAGLNTPNVNETPVAALAKTVPTATALLATSPPTTEPKATRSATTTPTVEPTAIASPALTSTPHPTPTATITPSPTLPPNPLGSVLVLEYHTFGEPEGRWQRTPDNFRADIERLFVEGYTPANIIDLSLGFPDLPARRKPVVLTFDDSDLSQFRYLADGSIDPNSAVGILYDFHLEHPRSWPLKGTFYVLQDVDVPERILFGQRELEDQKLQWLVEQGFEVGSHTISHFDLTAGTDEEVQWQLAVSQRQLQARLPGYEVRSLSVPFGNYPVNEALVRQGTWAGKPYTYANAVMVAGGASPSPHSSDFDPYRIPRVQALQTELDYWLDSFAQNPRSYFVSAGE